jgi:hypothetical protein
MSRPPETSIHVLDDDSLINLFSLCRPSFFDRDEYGNIWWGNWRRECWWYKLVQVCQRWRYLILSTASHLDLCLVCTHGTPVADMLAHSPPFPLIIDYDDENHDLTAEDEEGIMLALQHRDRVRHVHLRLHVPRLQKLIMATDDCFPILEYLYIAPPTKHKACLTLPPMFQAPHLRHLILNHFAAPIRSPLLTTAVGLVRLVLRWIHLPTPIYLHPNHLLQSLSLLSQLETLEIGFCFPVPNRDIERQLSNTPIVTHVTLPNLHLFVFWGTSIYLEALLPWMTTPLLERLGVHFFNQLSFPVPRLLQFMMTTENLRFSSAKFVFYHGAVSVFVYSRVESRLITFYIEVTCRHLDWQVSSVAQIFNVLSPFFSEVMDLTLGYREDTLSSDWHSQASPTRWRELLMSFRNVKILRVHKGLVGEVSRCLSSDEEPPLEVLPELKELVYLSGSIDDKAFAPFIHHREVAGQPVNLIGEDLPVYPPSNTGPSYSSTGMSHSGPG